LSLLFLNPNEERDNKVPPPYSQILARQHTHPKGDGELGFGLGFREAEAERDDDFCFLATTNQAASSDEAFPKSPNGISKAAKRNMNSIPLSVSI
jgi:hypothetical protein